MNTLEIRLKELNSSLYDSLQSTVQEVETLLTQYTKNFPAYTDHSIAHTREVFNITAELLTPEEINNLNADELYILSMACYLHDIGMCIPESKIQEISGTEEFLEYKKTHSELTTEAYIRDIHHELSNKFILEEWKLLKIPSEKYAEAIGLVSQGHRKVDLEDTQVYEPKFFVRNGREFVCLPFLSAVLRIADELDVTNMRTPEILAKYYMPENEFSIREWEKHIATTQRNFTEDFVRFEVTCSNQSMLAALEEQFQKITSVIKYGQKVIRGIGNTDNRIYTLSLLRVEKKFRYENFDPKGTKFSFDVGKVVESFIGKNLYKDELVAIRELVQNAIDSCSYRKTVEDSSYEPQIEIVIEKDLVKVNDNGMGMDLYVVENFFSKLGSSFYEQKSVKDQFEAIGQFGVGVFAYFLIADFIDVSTKSVSSEALRFRFDADPKSYFHFFDTSERKSLGTEVTLNLKKEFTSEHFSQRMADYLLKTFPFIDVSCSIRNKKSEPFVLNKGIQDDITISEFQTRSFFLKKKDLLNFEVISYSESNDFIEGVVFTLLPKDLSKSIDLGEILNHSEYHNVNRLGGSADGEYSEISLYQKGVLVNNYKFCLSYCLGQLNFRKKLNLNIDRDSLKITEEPINVFVGFAIGIFKQVFEKLSKSFPKENLPEMTERFAVYFLGRFPFSLDKRLFNYLKENLYVTIINQNERKDILLLDLFEGYTNLVFMTRPLLVKDCHERVRVLSFDKYNSFYEILCDQEKRFIPWVMILSDGSILEEARVGDYSSYKAVTSESLYELLGNHYFDYTYSDSDYFMFNQDNLKENGHDDTLSRININSRFIQQVISSKKTILNNPEFKERLYNAIDGLPDPHSLALNESLVDESFNRFNEQISSIVDAGLIDRIPRDIFMYFHVLNV